MRKERRKVFWFREWAQFGKVEVENLMWFFQQLTLYRLKDTPEALSIFYFIFPNVFQLFKKENEIYTSISLDLVIHTNARLRARWLKAQRERCCNSRWQLWCMRAALFSLYLAPKLLSAPSQWWWSQIQTRRTSWHDRARLSSARSRCILVVCTLVQSV